jgi:hypothetical protein
MGTGRQFPGRIAIAIAGAVLVVAGVTVVEASGQQVGSSTSAGYYEPPTAYNVGDAATFSYTVTNQTATTIDATIDFETARITSYEGIDVSTGYPALSEAQLAQNWGQTVQNFDIPVQSQPMSLPPIGTVTITFTTVPLTQCGYYQLDSEGAYNSVSGLFATGFIRVIGCTSPPSPLPSPTASPSPSPSASPSPSPSASPSPSPSVSPSPSPTGGNFATQTASPAGASPAVTTSTTGGVSAVSTPGTGLGPWPGGSPWGIALIIAGALLMLGALALWRRRVEAV